MATSASTEKIQFDLSLATDEKRTLLLSGVFSATGWIGAAAIGMFFL